MDENELRGAMYLALGHRDTRSRELFDAVRQGIDKKHKVDLLEYLVFIETDAALGFLDDVRSTVQDEEIRAAAETSFQDLSNFLSEVK